MAYPTYFNQLWQDCQPQIAPDGYGVTYGPDVLPDMWQLVKE